MGNFSTLSCATCCLSNDLSYLPGLYRGSIRYGKPHGHGIMKYDNGNRYKGLWDRGIKFGRGTMKYTNGDKYNGKGVGSKGGTHTVHTRRIDFTTY